MKEIMDYRLQTRYFLLMIFFCPYIAAGQVHLFSGGSGNTFNPFGTHVGDYLRVYEIPLVPSLAGSPYLDEEWENADIILNDDHTLINNIPVKIDVRNNWLEIKYKEKIYLLDDLDIYSLQLKKSGDAFITKNALQIDDLSGFFKVLYNEKTTLLCHFSSTIQRSNYIPAFDAGEKNDKLILIKTYYIFFSGQLTELEKNSRKFVKQFNSNAEIISFLKRNHINPKNEKDLLKFIKYYDSINVLKF
jgi:hypothetical protein